MEPYEYASEDFKRKLVVGAGIVAVIYALAIYGGHKYQMRRNRKRREAEEQDSSPKEKT